MKTATWLCPVLILLCATNFVYTTPGESYDGYRVGSRKPDMLMNKYLVVKRNRPSLSIVNPLDVLRQRLLLEIARRQMKENSKQVELNRAILKNVGKRMASEYSHPLTAASYNGEEFQQHQQQNPVQQRQTYEYELIPPTLIFDYPQQKIQQQPQQLPWLPYEYINDAIEGAASEDDIEPDLENAEQAIMAFTGDAANNEKHFIKQTHNEHSTSLNEPLERATNQKSVNNKNNDTKRFTLINSRQLNNAKNDLNLEHSDVNPVSAKPNPNDFNNEDNDYQLQRYFYHHLHKNQNHLTKK